jgi:hypothetical protein
MRAGVPRQECGETPLYLDGGELGIRFAWVISSRACPPDGELTTRLSRVSQWQRQAAEENEPPRVRLVMVGYRRLA